MINESEPRRLHLIACLTIIIVGSMVYSNTIHSSFQFDDYRNIVDNPAIKDLDNIPKFLFTSRGVVFTSFALNYYLSGLSVESYHWVNIFFHMVNGILVYLLAATLLNNYIRHTDGENTSRASVLALFVALLFITSPVQTHTVT